MDELKPTHETATSRVWFLRTADDSDGEVHEQRVEYLPGSPFPPYHFHPSQDERFEVESGRMLFIVDGAEHVLEAGDTLEIEKGTPHKARNPFAESATVRWETRPALRTTEFFDMSNQLGDEMGPLHGALLAHEYRDVFRTTGALGAVVLPAAGLARLLGRRLPGASRHG